MPSKRTEAEGESMPGAACGGCGFAAMTEFKRGRPTATDLTATGLTATSLTATGLTAARFAFGVTAMGVNGFNGNEMVGAERMGTDKDKCGELPGRPAFRRGDGEDKGRLMDGPTGATGDERVLTT